MSAGLESTAVGVVMAGLSVTPTSESVILTVDPSTLLTSNESGLQYRLGPNFRLFKLLALFLWLMCSGDRGTIWSVPVSPPSFT